MDGLPGLEPVLICFKKEKYFGAGPFIKSKLKVTCVTSNSLVIMLDDMSHTSGLPFTSGTKLNSTPNVEIQ